MAADIVDARGAWMAYMAMIGAYARGTTQGYPNLDSITRAVVEENLCWVRAALQRQSPPGVLARDAGRPDQRLEFGTAPALPAPRHPASHSRPNRSGTEGGPAFSSALETGRLGPRLRKKSRGCCKIGRCGQGRDLEDVRRHRGRGRV